MEPTQQSNEKFFSKTVSDYQEPKPLCPFRDKDCVERCALYIISYATTPPSGRCALKDIAKT